MIRCAKAACRAALIALAMLTPAAALAQSPGPAASPTRQLAEIDWEAAEADRAPRSAFLAPLNTGFSSVDTVSVPVLLPTGLDRDPSAPDGCRFFARNTSYSATFEMEDVMVEITGSRLVQAVLDSLVTENGGGEGYSRTDTAFGQQVSFTRYGAGYSVIVTCSDPAGEPRCRDAGFALDMARSLRMAGGRRG